MIFRRKILACIKTSYNLVVLGGLAINLEVIGGLACIKKSYNLVVLGEYGNNLTVHNGHRLTSVLDDTDRRRSLITVSNHRCNIDDPLMWSILGWRHISSNVDCMRWVSGAADICFTKPTHAMFFALGRTVPTIRGDGVYQKGMDVLLEKLNQRKWIHFFPEGRVNMKHIDMRLKWGVGRLINECEHVPLVLPIWICGLDDVLPPRPPYHPQLGKKVSIFVGEFIDFTELRNELKKTKATPRECRLQITNRIKEELNIVEKLTNEIHRSNH